MREAIRFLSRRLQQRLIDKWREVSHSHSGIDFTHGYRNAEKVRQLARALEGKRVGGGSAVAFAFARWGLYPVFEREVPSVLREIDEIDTAYKAVLAGQRANLEAEIAVRAAADAAAKAEVDRLLGEPNTCASWVQFGKPHPLIEGIDEVVYIPAAADYEPDPGRAGVLVKSPALAIRVRTTEFPIAKWYMAGGERTHYHGIDPLKRLRAVRPDLFKDAP